MIIQAETAEQIEEIRRVFREYEKWLDVDSCFQGFEAELADLPRQIRQTVRQIILICFENQPAGCAALRKIGD